MGKVDSADGVTNADIMRAFSILRADLTIPALPVFLPDAFPGLDSIINPQFNLQPWERAEFLERHFEPVDWGDLLRLLPGPLPIPGLRLDEDLERIAFYRLSEKPLTILVVWFFPRKPVPWDKDWPLVQPSHLYYRFKWRLWWRRIDPMKDAKLREILQGAMTLDALAGRDL